jgi:MFS family permease
MYNQDLGHLNAAYILSLIGGIFVLSGGIILLALGTVLSMFTFGLGFLGFLAGIIGIIWGILIIIIAIRLKSDPSNHMTYGILLIMFSILSFFGAIGGFVIGFILTLIGGIMAIIYNPSPQPYVLPQPPQQPPQ